MCLGLLGMTILDLMLHCKSFRVCLVNSYGILSTISLKKYLTYQIYRRAKPFSWVVDTATLFDELSTTEQALRGRPCIYDTFNIETQVHEAFSVR